MRILIVPDKFKGSLVRARRRRGDRGGARQALPSAQLEICPLADGGEGTAEAISRGACWQMDFLPGARRAWQTRDGPVHAGWLAEARTAVMEMRRGRGARRLAA